MKPSNLLLALLLVAPAASAQDRALDLWIGTIESEQNTLYLKRCDLAQNRYKLKELDASSGLLLSQIDVKKLKKGQHLVAEIVAEYRSENDHDILVIDSIQTIKVGKSCHLIDVLPGA
jgi:predicted ATP-dependent serine protease